MFNTVLVANRGEIALRVMRACHELGLRCIAVYSEADRDALHVHYADEAYLLGPAPSSESYLNIERIIAVAKQSGAGAIHPGYGFLAENADFVRAAIDAGMVFIGPPAKAMDRMGGKVAARREATDAKVPVVPGTLKALDSVADVQGLAEEYGYPIAIKAVGGGGGRGLRVVQGPAEIEAAFESARREAEVAFKNSALYVEKYLDNPRHIEIQIMADAHGNVVYVGERDCSIQRRHQKLVEECPSPALTPELRTEMGAASVRLAKSVGYVGAGTLEFLFQDGKFYFLEMNTRIQVEHTVTEMVYGLDLVKTQIRVAQGERLWFTQEDLVPHGHSIECRINAEDVVAGFRPALGTIGAYSEPADLGIRVASGVRSGWTIPQYYDSLLAKLVTWGQDRTEAIARMRRALKDFKIEGVATTIPFHQATMEHSVFASGDFSVNFIPRHPELIETTAKYTIAGNGQVASPEDVADPRSFAVEVNGRRFSVRVAEIGAPAVSASVAPKKAPTANQRRKGARATALEPKIDGVISPIQGTIAAVRAKPGQEVEAGQILFVVEAMKMENEITAPHAGVLSEVRIKQGEAVEAGAVLATYQS
ncbi:MAG: acetyl-CoA carboxylase biotin carboxylase subunit [Chloroflexales bacterium]|nr:acetyl-CoA carboxylase biotin carboxylase subunit [Chloroflexales bacterium]